MNNFHHTLISSGFRRRKRAVQAAVLAPLLALASGLLLSGCATNPVSGKSDFVMMTEKQEIDLGRKYHQELLKRYPPYEDEALQAYVREIGERLAAESHRNHLVFHFTVIDSPIVNAFAVPGGYIYISRGIMAYMNSEAELAGVLGHEIGHVTARHSVRQQAKAQTAGILTAVLGAAYGRSAGELGNIAGTAFVLGYGRSYELEADRLGAEYLARGEYDPQDMIGVVGILKDQEEFEKQRAEAEGREPNVYHGLFASHPRNDQRLQEVVQAAEKFKMPGAEPGKGRDEFLKRVNGMVYGHSESQGVLRGNSFYHNDLNMYVEFPKGWRVENLPDRLIATGPDQNEILQIKQRDRNIKQPPEDFLNGEFKNLEDGQRLRTGAGPGYAGVTKLRTAWGSQPVRVAAVYHGKKIIEFAGARKGDLPEDAFFDMVESFRPLKQSERKLAESRKIKIVRSKRGDTFATLAEKSGLTNYAEAQLRLLNGMYPDGEPTPGQMIKIVE